MIYAHWFKRPLDVVSAGAGIVLLLPVFAVLAVLVWITSGRPVLFRQVRVGRNGTQFVMLKFRTMRVNAPDLRNSDSTTFNAVDDQRVTPIGRLLRASSLDELPQLFNVLWGDMSLVGGRPDLPSGVAGYKPYQRDRLLVRPGITSWAMLHGRNNVPLDERRDLDAWYAHNVGFLLDARILLGTLRIVVRREGVVNEFSRRLGDETAPGEHAAERP